MMRFETLLFAVGFSIWLLSGSDAKPVHRFDPNRTALTNAISNKDLKSIRMLISTHADVNEEDSEGAVPLQYASQSGRPEIVALLLSAGADVNKKGHWGPSSLQMAVEMSSGNVEIAKQLIAAGANVNAESGGYTVLNIAAQDSSVDVLKLLLDRGADPNHVEPKGTTAIYWAALNCNVEKTELLLAHRADPNKLDAQGKRAVDVANTTNPDPSAQRNCVKVRALLTENREQKR